MQRRTFIKDVTLSVVAVSTCGFIRFDGEHYVGDCETTTDILGPFYRPGSPVRTNLVPTGSRGAVVELSGTIRHNDCKTPYTKAKVELWHCDPDGVYDNTSEQFRYRGTTFSDSHGRYAFTTHLPVPYSTGGNTRPAHFHLMITAEGYQPFVTQLYFAGDEHIARDPFASSPNAQRRILQVRTAADGTRKVTYDISMAPKLAADTAVIDRLTGVYHDEKDPAQVLEFFKQGNLLWMKNEVFGMHFDYRGGNTFQYPGRPGELSLTLRFDVLPQGGVKVTRTLVDRKGVSHVTTALKAL